MIRKLACAVVILGISLGVASAEVLKGKILKVDAKSITFRAGKGKEAKTYEVAKDVKVCKMVKKDQKEELAGGLKAEALQKIGEKGIYAHVVTNDDGKVTEIILMGGKKKNKK